MVVVEEGVAVGLAGREIIRGSAADLMSKSCCCCCCCCDLVVDWTLDWSGEEVDDEEGEDRGVEVVVIVVVVEAARRLVDDDDAVELEMMNLGRDGLAVVGRYGEEEARGRVERAERS